MRMNGLPTRNQRAMQEWFRTYGMQQNVKAVKEYIKNGGKKVAPDNVASLIYVAGSMNPDTYLYTPGRYTQEDQERYEDEIMGARRWVDTRTEEEKAEARKKMDEDWDRQEEEARLKEEHKNPNFEIEGEQMKIRVFLGLSPKCK